MTVLAVATFAELKGAVEGCARVIQIVDDIVFDAEPVTIASQCSQPMAFVGLGGQRRFAASGEHHFINIESGVEASFEFIDFVGGTNTDKEVGSELPFPLYKMLSDGIGTYGWRGLFLSRVNVCLC